MPFTSRRETFEPTVAAGPIVPREIAEAFSGRREGELLDAAQIHAGLNEDGKLAFKTILKNDPAVLFALDAKGKTAFEHLKELAAQAAVPDHLRLHRENSAAIGDDFHIVSRKALNQIIIRLAYPDGGTQDEHGVCAAESISTLLNMQRPGEWVRIARDVMEQHVPEPIPFGFAARLHRQSVDQLRAEATELRNPPPPNFPLPKDFHSSDHSKFRSELDARMHAAIMSMAGNYRPEDGQLLYQPLSYQNQTDTFVDAKGTQRPSGLTDPQANAVLDKLLGMPHTTVTDLRVLTAALKASTIPVYCALDWGAEGSADESHAVIRTKIDEARGRVYFRNPHGDTGLQNGQELKDPPRRIEDASTGLESMEIAEYFNRLESAVVPNHLLIQLANSDPKFLADMLVGDWDDHAQLSSIIKSLSPDKATLYKVEDRFKKNPEEAKEATDNLISAGATGSSLMFTIGSCPDPHVRTTLFNAAMDGNANALAVLTPTEQKTFKLAATSARHLHVISVCNPNEARLLALKWLRSKDAGLRWEAASFWKNGSDPYLKEIGEKLFANNQRAIRKGVGFISGLALSRYVTTVNRKPSDLSEL